MSREKADGQLDNQGGRRVLERVLNPYTGRRVQTAGLTLEAIAFATGTGTYGATVTEQGTEESPGA